MPVWCRFGIVGFRLGARNSILETEYIHLIPWEGKSEVLISVLLLRKQQSKSDPESRSLLQIGKSPEYQRLMSFLGYVYLHSPTHLGFATDRNRPSLRKVAELELVHDGDEGEGQNYIFSVGDLDKLADPLRLRRKRRVSEAEKERLRSIGMDSQFKRNAA